MSGYSSHRHERGENCVLWVSGLLDSDNDWRDTTYFVSNKTLQTGKIIFFCCISIKYWVWKRIILSSKHFPFKNWRYRADWCCNIPCDVGRWWANNLAGAGTHAPVKLCRHASSPQSRTFQQRPLASMNYSPNAILSLSKPLYPLWWLPSRCSILPCSSGDYRFISHRLSSR